MPTRDSLGRYLAGDGILVLIEVPDPGAGLQWSYDPDLIIPTDEPGFWRRIRAISFVLTADANVGNRTIRLVFQTSDPALPVLDPVLQIFNGQFSLAVTANTSTTFSAGPGLEDFGVAGRSVLATPATRMAPGLTAIGTPLPMVRSQAVGFQAGDAYSGIRLWVEMWDRT